MTNQTLHDRTSTRGTRRGAARRGAAMTEAVVAIPFFIMMFAATLFIGETYRQKLRTHRTAREKAWVHASANCQSDQADTNPSDGSNVPPENNNPGQGAPGSDVLSKGYDEAHATVEGEAVASNILGGQTVTLKSESWVTCNEAPRDGDPIGVFKYVGDVISDVKP
jgi:hypothetical protein